jgi:hypothetical protein
MRHRRHRSTRRHHRRHSVARSSSKTKDRINHKTIPPRERDI